MLENGRGLIKALENWAKKVTSGYQDVAVRDLSTSFRDGMAFCAIIHHYRPDLIDFDSLSKENIFENNSLAFGVAEKQLGVPALLDAEDMVKYEKPDRLSIITYLSQLRNCFENQNKVKPKSDFKKIQKLSSGPPAKVAALEPTFLAAKRHEVCQVCKHRVFILERLIVHGKLYHTTCFRCHKCNCLLNPGAYIESDIEGVYECSVCLVDEAPVTPTPAPRQSILRNTSDIKIHTPEPLPIKERKINTADVINFAQSNLSQQSEDTSEKFVSLSYMERTISPPCPEVENSSRSSVSVRDKIHAFEKIQPGESPVNTSPVTPVKQRISFSKLNSSIESPAKSPSNTSSDSHVHSSLNSSVLSSQNSTFPKSVQSEIETAKLKSARNSVSSGENCDKPLNMSLNQTNKPFILESQSNKPFVQENQSNKPFILENQSSKPFVQENQSSNVPSFDTNGINSSDKNIKLSKTLVSSPKITRDIFKTSLQPLKLPSTIRRETPASAGRTLDIPSLKSSSQLTAHSLKKNLSFSLQSSKSLTEPDSSSENNVDLEITNQRRRKSLESSASDKATDLPVKDSNQVDRIDSQKLHSNNFDEIHSKSFNSTISLSDENLDSTLNKSRILLSNDIPPQTTGLSIHTALSEKQDDKDISDRKSSIVINDKPILLMENGSKPPQKLDSVIKAESKSVPVFELRTSPQIAKEEEYPDDLNPFGDDDANENGDEYPDDLNPFGDDDAVDESFNSETQYDESKNPFASDDDDETVSHSSLPLKFPTPPEVPSFDSLSSNKSSPSSSLKGTLKKRPAPKPPALNDIFPKTSNLDASSKSLEKRTPTPRKNKPAPPPPMDATTSPKVIREIDEKPKPSKEVKRKKRPAPPVPIPMRQDMKKIPLQEILREMKEIEEKQREFERQGREIELLIRDKDKDDEASVEEEEYIMQLFELVNQKNALFRRQAELMYIKRSQRLEEQQYKIEKEIRLLMEKPDSEKTEEDRGKENELTLELIDIVDQRNSIIDSIEMDRRRELEEDHSVKEQLEMKNGDLPIPAEIKEQKISGKKKKKKKDKKKLDDQESGKGTLKRTKLFSRKL